MKTPEESPAEAMDFVEGRLDALSKIRDRLYERQRAILERPDVEAAFSRAARRALDAHGISEAVEGWTSSADYETGEWTRWGTVTTKAFDHMEMLHDQIDAETEVWKTWWEMVATEPLLQGVRLKYHLRIRFSKQGRL